MGLKGFNEGLNFVIELQIQLFVAAESPGYLLSPIQDDIKIRPNL